MCGIAGIVYKNSKIVKENLLVEIGQTIAHRGPDSFGIFNYENIGFVHRRLSILDLTESGNQPFISPCGRFILIYNGEIFNFKEFYPELKLKGFDIKSNSDTEVLLYLLIVYGTNVLERLNGFFAFSFFDRYSGVIILARDRFGVKPLFYSQNSDFFTFASEPKAIFKSGIEKKINESAIDELFFYRYISGENTSFENVFRLLPGHLMIVSKAGEIKEIKRWFSLKDSALNFEEVKNPIEWFEESFHKSINYRMISDVAVGTLLSGGLDSSSVLFSQAVQKYTGLSSWNISFSNYKHDESAIARRFSEELGVKFNSFEFTGKELIKLIEEAIYFHDEPLTHLQDGHLLGISRHAKNDISVLLSGEGADEILGGYVRYKVFDQPWRYQFLDYLRYIPNKYLKSDRLKKMKRYLAEGDQNFQMMCNSNEIFLSDLTNLGVSTENLRVAYRETILDEGKSLYPKNKLRQLLYLEQHTHLFTLNDRNDRATMAASIECRDPFLDPNLVIGVASLPDHYFNTKGKGKKLLLESIGLKLPEYITKHPKIGLSIPWNDYFIKDIEFSDYFDSISKSKLFEFETFEKLQISQIIKDFKIDGKTNYGIVRQLFFLSLWYRIQFGD